jgi:hypothetical protein
MRFKARSICFVLGVCISVSTATVASAKSSHSDETPNIVLDCALGFDALVKMIEQLPQSPSEDGIRIHTVDDPMRIFFVAPEDHPAAPLILLSAFIETEDATYLQRSHCGYGDQKATEAVVNRASSKQPAGGRGFTIYPPIGKEFRTK